MENIVVGSKDCPISEVLKTLDSFPDFLRVKNNWDEFAIRLDTPSDAVNKLRQDMLMEKIGLFYCLNSILELWVARLGKDARIEKLAAGLEEMGLKGCRDSLSSIPFNKYLSKPSFTWSELTERVQEQIVATASHQTGVKFNLEHHKHIFSTLDFSILKQLIKGETVQLFRESLPEDIPYYVPRRVAPRNIISNDIFSEKSGNDIFLFSKLDMPELYIMAGNAATGYSRDNLEYQKVRFMILNEFAHFDIICKRTNKNVHLLEKEDTLLKWKKTRGSVKVLQDCQGRGKDEFREDIFKTLGSDLPVIISDTAGMGKSTLLAKIGKLICESSPTFIVSFVIFPDFIRQIKDLSAKASLSLKEVIGTVLETTICLNGLGQNVFKSKLYQGDKQIELLLDGFDEIVSEDTKLAFQILSTTSSFKSLRIWITSRPQFLHKLENTLNVMGFNIPPFNRQDQIQFFMSYWSRSRAVDKLKLKSFSEICLDTLNMQLSDKDNVITGIPLQCLMIGEVFEDYLELENAEEILKSSIRSITDLYQRFIERKLKKFERVYGLTEKERMVLFEAHAKLSFELIFENSQQSKQIFGEAIVSRESILNVGIVEDWSSTDQSPKFIHRTFAEYLVAWFIVEKLSSEIFWSKDIINVFFFDVLDIIGTEYIRSVDQPFRHSVVCHFLCSLLADLNLKDSLLTKLINTVREELAAKKDSPIKICYAAVTDNYWGIFVFLDEIHAFNEIEDVTFTKSFLRVSIQFGDIQIFERALRHFEINYNLTEQIKIQLLEEALEKGNFLIVQFLLKTKGLHELVKISNLALLHFVVKNTYGNAPAEIRQKKDLIKVLCHQNPSLLKLVDQKGRPALATNFVHCDLFDELVKLGADVNWKHPRTLRTLVHQTAADFNLPFLIHLLNNHRLGINDVDSNESTPLDILANIIQLSIRDKPQCTPNCQYPPNIGWTKWLCP